MTTRELTQDEKAAYWNQLAAARRERGLTNANKLAQIKKERQQEKARK